MDGAWREFYYDYTYKPLFDADGAVYGIMCMAIDVTDRVLARRQIEQSRFELLTSFEQALVGADDDLDQQARRRSRFL